MENELTADKGLHVDVDIFEQHRVESQERVHVAQDDAVHHHEDVSGLLEPRLHGVRDDQLQLPLVLYLAEAEFRDEFHQDFTHRGEAGVVVQVILAAFDGLQKEVLPVGHEGSQRVDAEGLLGTQRGLPGDEVLPLGRAQAELGQRPGIGPDERAFKVDVASFPVQVGHFADDFPVSIDVGGIVPDQIRTYRAADVEAGGISGRGQRGIGITVFAVHHRPLEPGGDDFSVVFRNGRRAGSGPDARRKRIQKAFRGVFPGGREEVVLMPDGQAYRRLRTDVAEDEGGRGVFRKPRAGGNLQAPLRGCFGAFQGIVGRFVQKLDAVRNTGGGSGVENGQDAGTGYPGHSLLIGVDGRIGDEPVGAGGCCDGNPERSGAAAFQKAYFGRTGRSAFRDEFQVGNGAFV